LFPTVSHEGSSPKKEDALVSSDRRGVGWSGKRGGKKKRRGGNNFRTKKKKLVARKDRTSAVWGAWPSERSKTIAFGVSSKGKKKGKPMGKPLSSPEEKILQSHIIRRRGGGIGFGCRKGGEGELTIFLREKGE